MIPSRPPPLRLDADLRWLLARAFGPDDADLRPADGDAACALAVRLDLAARIAARHPSSRLEAEVGAPAAATLAAHALAAEANVRGLRRTLARLDRALAPLEARALVLKGMALDRLGCLAPGARHMSDLDVLLAPREARRLHGALRHAGWRVADAPATDHHLRGLVAPDGTFVEIHTRLPGLPTPRPDDRTPDPDHPAIDLPTPGLLAAHLLVHGLAQHGDSPEAYALPRLLADLQDLGLGGAEGATLEADARRHLSSEGAEALAAVGTLLADLGRLALPPVGDALGERPSERLLRHVVGGRRDADYAGALRLRGLARPDEGRPLPAQLATGALAALFPTDAQLDAIYGPGSAPRRLLLRLARPLDLARRAARAGWGALRARLRRP